MGQRTGTPTALLVFKSSWSSNVTEQMEARGNVAVDAVYYGTSRLQVRDEDCLRL